MASRVLRPSVPLHRLAVPAATRGLATPAGQHKSQSRPTPTNAKDARGETPVDDIDLVFDYPSEGQGSYQKQSLEASGLDLHSAMPHHPKQQGQGHGPGAGGRGGQQSVGMGNAMGWMDSGVMYRYISLGALGLGGLYMVMRRRDGGTMKGAAQSTDLSAKKPLENKAEKMIGRGG